MNRRSKKREECQNEVFAFRKLRENFVDFAGVNEEERLEQDRMLRLGDDVLHLFPTGLQFKVVDEDF